MFRNALIAVLIVTTTPVLAFDLPLLTFPEAPVASTSTSNGK